MNEPTMYRRLVVTTRNQARVEYRDDAEIEHDAGIYHGGTLMVFVRKRGADDAGRQIAGFAHDEWWSFKWEES